MKVKTMNNINEIEKELSVLLQADKKSWVRIYELIEQVDREKMWEGTYKSFTAWIRALSAKVKVHESLLWKRKKAGQVYSEYEKRAAANGISVPSMNDIQISPDNFELIEKIAQGNSKVQDDLIKKAITGEIKRADLKNAWATVRADKEARGQKATRSNAYEMFEQDEKNINNQKNKITATDIVLSLSNNSWMKSDFNLNEKSTYKEKRIYSTMSEFPVHTGTTQNSRRIDLLVLENETVNAYDLILHGVEIKVSKSDLVNDHKMSEYQDFVDYFWIAVPSVLVNEAIQVADDGWGIISVDVNKKAKIERKAKLYLAQFKDIAMKNALLKIL